MPAAHHRTDLSTVGRPARPAQGLAWEVLRHIRAGSRPVFVFWPRVRRTPRCSVSGRANQRRRDARKSCTVEFPYVLTRDLLALTEALDNPGTDLQAVLAVLADDLRAVVPSFIGLEMTVEAGGSPVTLTAVDPLEGQTAGASLQLPLDLFGTGPVGGTVVFYAANPGAFVDLGADSRRIFSLDGQVVIDGHLTSDLGSPGLRGLSEATAVNRAIGILIEQGRSSLDARDQLHRLAATAGHSIQEAAEQLLASVSPPITDSEL